MSCAQLRHELDEDAADHGAGDRAEAADDDAGEDADRDGQRRSCRG